MNSSGNFVLFFVYAIECFKWSDRGIERCFFCSVLCVFSAGFFGLGGFGFGERCC